MGILFFRNTHQAPDFKEYRLDPWSFSPTLVVHFLDHRLGKNLLTLWQDVSAYDGEVTLINLLRELADGLEDTSIKVRIT